MNRRHHNRAATHTGHQIRKSIRPWHRRLGLLGALFLMLLTLSGVAINHADGWGLAHAKVRIGWLLDYYGIQAPAHSRQFDDLGVTDNLLWQQQRLLLEARRPLLAAGHVNSMIVAIDAEQLYLLSSNGELLETQDKSTGLPTPLSGLAIEGSSQVWLEGEKGQYLADEDFIEWRQATSFVPLNWLEGSAASESLLLQARSANLTWERLLLDLHSGRLFGSWAIWLWDLLAACFVFLSLSGLYIWWSQRPRRK